MLIALVVVTTTLLKLITTAPVWIHFDENYYLNIGQNFIERGELTPYMWRLGNETNIVAGSGSGYGILLLTGWLQLVGVSLVKGRLLMVVLGLLTAGIMYFVAARWWQSRAAGLVALTFALVSTSPFYSYVVRMDAPGMLAYSVVLLLHIYAVWDRVRWLHFATGVAVVISVEFHSIGIVYLGALTVWYLLEYISEVWRQRTIVLNTGPVYYGIGGFIAGMVYIAIHILPDPAAYFSIPSSCFQCDPSSFNEVIRYARFMLLRAPEFVLLFVVLITAFYRRRPEDRHFMILLITWLIVLPLVGVPPFTHYTAHLWPLLAIGTAGFIARGIQAHGRLLRWRVSFGLAGALLLLVFNVVLHITGSQPFELRRDIADNATVEYIRQTLPDDTVIMGEVDLFYYLSGYSNFMTYRDTDEYGVAGRGESQVDYWRREQPLVVIGDDRVDDPELDQYMTEFGFREVRPDLWIAEQLLVELNITGETLPAGEGV